MTNSSPIKLSACPDGPISSLNTYLPNFRHTILIHRDLGVNASSRITVPVPDATKIGTGLHDLAFETLLAELVHQVDATEPSTHNHHISLELLGIILIVWVCSLVRGPDISPKMNHDVERD